jgi:chorismate-pyruvate lyase
LQLVDGAAVPEPFRGLLVHTDDMTPTLERFYGQGLLLRVLNRRRSSNEYIREVVLVLEGDGRRVEFGANRIRLDRFPAGAQRAILEETQPLGHILRDHAIAHTCHPGAFLRVASDRLINEALGLTGAQVLWGRHNQLRNPAGELLSEVVEILRAPSGD